jgi:hypothetical protein
MTLSSACSSIVMSSLVQILLDPTGLKHCRPLHQASSLLPTALPARSGSGLPTACANTQVRTGSSTPSRALGRINSQLGTDHRGLAQPRHRGDRLTGWAFTDPMKRKATTILTTTTRNRWISSHNSTIRASFSRSVRWFRSGRCSCMLIPCNLTRFFQDVCQGG